MARAVRPSERRLLLVVADVLTAIAAVTLSMWTWSLTAGVPFSAAFMTTHALWFLSVPVWVIALAPTRQLAVSLDLRVTLVGLGKAGGVLFVAYLIVFFYAGRDALPRLMALYVLWNSTGLALAGRLFLLWALTRDQFSRRLIIVGDPEAIGAALSLFAYPALRGTQLVGLVTSGAVPTSAILTLGAPSDIDRIANEFDADEVVVALDREASPELLERLLRCQEAGIDVISLAQLYEQLLRRVPIRLVSPVWLLTHLFGAAGTRETSPLAKRLLDIAAAVPLAAAGVIVSGVVALAIVIDSRGPVFYQQVRLGRAGRRFRIVKFRTMRTDAESNGPQWSTAGDARITRVGRILRRSHLDELPQLMAVIRGDMSMVGPRPERPEFVALLEREVPLYRARLTVAPGLTGWAQINQGYADSVDDAAGKLEYDLYYVRHRSVWFDMEILIGTVGRMLGWRGR